MLFPIGAFGGGLSGSSRVYPTAAAYRGLPEVLQVMSLPSSHLLQYPYLSVLNSVQYFLATIFPTTSRDDEE